MRLPLRPKPGHASPRAWLGFLYPWLIALLTLCLAPASVATAQIRDGIETPIQPLRIMNYGGALFFESHYQQDTETRSGRDTTTTDTYFREGVDLNIDGYVYHPNMVEWFGSVRVGFSQQETDLAGRQRETQGTLLGFNLMAILLREKPVGGRVWATMSQDVLDRGFALPVQLDRSTQGAELLYRGKTPLSVLVEHRTTTEQTEFRIDDADTYYLRIDAADRRDRNWVTRLIYEFEDTTETSTFLGFDGATATTQDLSDQRHELNVSNQYAFGQGAQLHQLTGQLRALHRTGFFVQDTLVADQRLDLFHSPTLSSYYQGSFSYDQVPDQSDRLIQGEAGVRKSFYRSLETTLRVLGSDRELSNGQETSFGAFADLDYTKKTPIGRLNSNLTVGREFQTEQFDGAIRLVRDETAVLAGITPVTLRQPNVTPGSVLVTDSSNAILFIEGFDYTLRTLGAFTEVVRIPSGTIADGQAVLIDYEAATARDAQFTTNTINWRVSLDLKVIPATIYGEYRLRDETLTSGLDPGNLEHDESMLAGMEYTLGPAVIAAEYEIRTLRLSPGFTAYRLRASVIQRLGPRTNLNCSGLYEHRDYTEAERFGLAQGEDYLDTISAAAALTTKLRDDLLLRADARYYQTQGREEDSLARVGLGLNWSRGQMDVSLDTWLGYFTQRDDQGISAFVGVRVRRSF